MKKFKTKKEVVEYLESLEKAGMLTQAAEGWEEVQDTGLTQQYGWDDQRFDQYTAPSYIPTRYKDGWGISKINHWINPHPEHEKERVNLSIKKNKDGCYLSDGSEWELKKNKDGYYYLA